MKDQAEAQREAIFSKLAAEEKRRRDQAELIENMRMDLNLAE